MRTEAELSQLRSKVSTLETELVETRKVLLETRLQMNDCTKQAAFSAGLLLKANVNDVKESLSVVMVNSRPRLLSVVMSSNLIVSCLSETLHQIRG